MLKSKFLSFLFLSNLFFASGTCFSKTTEMDKGNSGNYFGVDAISKLNSDEESEEFEPTLIKAFYRYSWNRNGFSIGPKIFTTINVSDNSEDSKFYTEKQFLESALFNNNKVGLGLSIGFDLSDNVALIGTISGVRQFNDFAQQKFDDFGYALEFSLQIALGRNINAQVSFERTSFSIKDNGFKGQGSRKHKHQGHRNHNEWQDEYTRRHENFKHSLGKINVDSISVGLSYKF